MAVNRFVKGFAATSTAPRRVSGGAALTKIGQFIAPPPIVMCTGMRLRMARSLVVLRTALDELPQARSAMPKMSANGLKIDAALEPAASAVC